MTRQLSADIAVPSQCYLAEGPVWDSAAGTTGRPANRYLALGRPAGAVAPLVRTTPPEA